MSTPQARRTTLAQQLFQWHNGASALAPIELGLGVARLPRKILLVGHCHAQDWGFHERNLTKTPVDFLLVNNLQVLPPKTADEINAYDFQVIQLPLRFVFGDTTLWGAQRRSDEELEQLFSVCQEKLFALLDLYTGYLQSHGLTTLVVNFMCPAINPLGRLMPKHTLRNPQYFVARLNEALEKRVATWANCYSFDLDGLSAYFGKRLVQEDLLNVFSHGAFLPANPADSTRIELAPPLQEHFIHRGQEFRDLLWLELLAAFRTFSPSAPAKLLVLDLDDTLWRGTIADELEPLDAQRIEGWPLGIVEALAYFKDRGGLLAILSRNPTAAIHNAWSVLYESRFSLRNFVCVKGGHTPKPEGMLEILQETNLTPESVVFIDDNPAERAGMKAAFPGMRVLHGYHYYWRKIILLSPETQVSHISAESQARTELIQKRQHIRQQMDLASSRSAFLQDLDISVQLGLLTLDEGTRVSRCFELLNKTNQFNTTGRRWTPAEFRNFLALGQVYYFAVSDRLTQHGTVGVVLMNAGFLEQFVMSCRVTGLDVEFGVMQAILQHREALGEVLVEAQFTVTPLNAMCADFWLNCGFSVDGERHRLVLAERKPLPFLGRVLTDWVSGSGDAT